MLFQGALPVRPENLDGLEKAGVALSLESTPEGMHWAMRAVHPSWGECEIVCLRDQPPPPDVLIEHDSRLTPAEKQRARLGQTSVSIRMDSRVGEALRDRKRLLRFLHAASGGDAVAILDHVSQAFWSEAALEEELAHDADLDILALFTVHGLTRDGEPYWMHSHGLRELGFFDFDVLDPSPSIGQGWDIVRALAFAIVEGKVRVGGEPIPLVGGGPSLRMLDARAFHRRCADRYSDWASAVDDQHLDNHAIVCDPPRKRFLGLFEAPPAPWSVLSLPSFDGLLITFSDEATELMSARARSTWDLFCALREEFAELDLPILVKLRYEAERAEHLWFKVESVTDTHVGAILINEPFGDLGMTEGDRRDHSIDRLSDWTIITPLGQITPRSLDVARSLREQKDEIARLLREQAGD